MFALPKIIEDLYTKITKSTTDANAYADTKFKENSHNVLVGSFSVDAGATFKFKHDLNTLSYYLSLTPLNPSNLSYDITKTETTFSITNNGSLMLNFDYQIFS